MRKAQPQQGVTVLRDELTGEVTAEPDRVRALAAEYTGRLLGTQPAVLPPADQPWQADALWAPTLRQWTHSTKADASRLALHEDIKTIIAKAGAASAPGMDGVQCNALKLLLSIDERKAGKEGAGTGPGPLLTMLTNLTNTILRADTLHQELGKSEIVYFHKNGDPTTLTNYSFL
jgi:hypothetical protein